MSENWVVLLREDPMTTGRPVEGLRIALGLSTGNSPLTIILLGKARILLTEDALDVVDADILEKYLPAIQDLNIPLLVPKGSSEEYSLSPEFTVEEICSSKIQSHLCDAHRVLVLG